MSRTIWAATGMTMSTTHHQKDITSMAISIITTILTTWSLHLTSMLTRHSLTPTLRVVVPVITMEGTTLLTTTVTTQWRPRIIST